MRSIERLSQTTSPTTPNLPPRSEGNSFIERIPNASRRPLSRSTSRRKEWWLVAIIITAGLSASSCGSGDTSTTPSTKPAASSETRVVPLAKNAAGCVETFDAGVDYFPVKSIVESSTLWDVEYRLNYKVIRASIDSLTGGDGAADPRTDTYVLVQCGTPPPPLDGDLAGAEVIEVPVQNAIPTYYEDVTALYELGLDDKILAIPDVGFLEEKGKSLPTSVMDLVAAGEISEFGETVSKEVFVAADPGVVFAYSVYGYEDHDLLETAGVPVVGVLNAAEATPLGDAEWVKFFALFFNAEADANDLFEQVSTSYLALKAQTASVPDRPEVVFISPYSADYFEAHTNSWGARLIEDAGGTNLLADDGPTSPQAISAEVVIDSGSKATLWLTEFSAFDLTATKTALPSIPFDEFPAVANSNIWNIGQTAPDDDVFYGTWSTRPDLLLADLVSLLHPDLVPDHKFSILEPPLGS